MHARERNRNRLAKATLSLLVVGSCAWLITLSRFASVETLDQSSLDDLQGPRIEFPGEPGFWVSYPVHPSGIGIVGGSAPMTWMMRKGFTLVRCEQSVLFKSCWGSKLSTIVGGNWHADPTRYQMTPRLYFHYKPVASRRPNSVKFGDTFFVKDAASADGDYRPILSSS